MTIGDLTMGPQTPDSVQTTDATANVLLIEIPIPDNCIAVVALHIEGIHWEDSITLDTLEGVTRNGANAVYSGQVKETRLNNGSAAWAYTVDCSGANLRVRITGEAGHTINWSCVPDFRACFEVFA